MIAGKHNVRAKSIYRNRYLELVILNLVLSALYLSYVIKIKKAAGWKLENESDEGGRRATHNYRI